MTISMSACLWSLNSVVSPNALSNHLVGSIRTVHAVQQALLFRIVHFNPLQHLTLVATWGTFLVAALATFYFEIRNGREEISLRSFLKFCFPSAGWKSHSTRTDIVLYFAHKIIDPLLGIAGFFIVGLISVYISRFLLTAGLPPIPHRRGLAVAVGLGFVFFLVNDFANYLCHLAEHQLPCLWEFHKVHHTATFLTPLTIAREHPLVMVFESVVQGALVGLVVGFSRAYWGYSVAEMMGMLASANMLATLLVLDSLRHSQFPISFGPFDRVFISPHMHQLHHSLKEAHWNKNMGNMLSIWDVCFSTFFIPLRGETLQYGSGSSAEDEQYRSVLRCWVLPFVNNYRKLTATTTPRPHPVLNTQHSLQSQVQETAFEPPV